jgi:cytochrome bd-type quinol oxidase subunit 2
MNEKELSLDSKIEGTEGRRMVMEERAIRSYSKEEIEEAEDLGKGNASDCFVIFAGILLVALCLAAAFSSQVRDRFATTPNLLVSAFAGLAFLGCITSFYSYMTLKSEKYKNRAKKKMAFYLSLTLCILFLGLVVYPAIYNVYMSLD